MSELRDNPEVLYGAAIALLNVILLTPAVGGMARILGVVDNPDARRLNRSPIPRLGGLAIVHAENDILIAELMRQNAAAGHFGPRANAAARPPEGPSRSTSRATPAPTRSTRPSRTKAANRSRT